MTYLDRGIVARVVFVPAGGHASRIAVVPIKMLKNTMVLLWSQSKGLKTQWFCCGPNQNVNSLTVGTTVGF